MENKKQQQQHLTRQPEDFEEEEDHYVSQLSNCANLYIQLETCLGEHNRDWRKCQDIVKKLKICSEKNQSNTKTTTK